RNVGQVTYVISGMREVACAAAPSTLHAYGACPWVRSHGKEWSEVTEKSNPASSARTTWSTSSRGPACSVIIVYLICTIKRGFSFGKRENRQGDPPGSGRGHSPERGGRMALAASPGPDRPPVSPQEAHRMSARPLPVSTPAEQGVDARRIQAFLDAVEAAPDIEPHSLMILRHGRLVASGWWAPYSADRLHLLYSLSKSFTST